MCDGVLQQQRRGFGHFATCRFRDAEVRKQVDLQVIEFDFKLPGRARTSNCIGKKRHALLAQRKAAPAVAGYAQRQKLVILISEFRICACFPPGQTRHPPEISGIRKNPRHPAWRVRKIQADGEYAHAVCGAWFTQCRQPVGEAGVGQKPASGRQSATSLYAPRSVSRRSRHRSALSTCRTAA